MPQHCSNLVDVRHVLSLSLQTCGQDQLQLKQYYKGSSCRAVPQARAYIAVSFKKQVSFSLCVIQAIYNSPVKQISMQRSPSLRCSLTGMQVQPDYIAHTASTWLIIVLSIL